MVVVNLCVMGLWVIFTFSFILFLLFKRGAKWFICNAQERKLLSLKRLKDIHGIKCCVSYCTFKYSKIQLGIISPHFWVKSEEAGVPVPCVQVFRERTRNCQCLAIWCCYITIVMYNASALLISEFLSRVILLGQSLPTYLKL